MKFFTSLVLALSLCVFSVAGPPHHSHHNYCYRPVQYRPLYVVSFRLSPTCSWQVGGVYTNLFLAEILSAQLQARGLQTWVSLR